MAIEKRKRKPPPPRKRRQPKYGKVPFPRTFKELEPLRRGKSKQFFEGLNQWYKKQPIKVIMADLRASAFFDSNEFTLRFNKEFESKEMYDEDIADFVLREKTSASLRWYAELYEFWAKNQERFILLIRDLCLGNMTMQLPTVKGLVKGIEKVNAKTLLT